MTITKKEIMDMVNYRKGLEKKFEKRGCYLEFKDGTEGRGYYYREIGKLDETFCSDLEHLEADLDVMEECEARDREWAEEWKEEH